MMLKIGDFARIGQVSIKTLRHYDALGLLRPVRVDAESGYRFYTMEQLGDLMRILALKDCGLSLEDIAHLLQTQGASDIKAGLLERLAAQQQVVAEEQARLQRITARVQQLESAETGATFAIALKQSEPLTLLGLRHRIASTQEIARLAWALVKRLEQERLWPLGPLVQLYFSDGSSDDQIDLFVGVPVTGLPLAGTDWLYERLSGGELLACLIYQGDYGNISTAYLALDRWLATSSYQVAGPYRELYHRSPLHTDDPSSYITEIQCPVLAAHAEQPLLAERKVVP